MVGDPNTSKGHLRDSLKQKVQEGVAAVSGAKENALEEAEDRGISKEKVGKVAHDIKHYGQFGEDYLGFSDPTKDLRKAVKQKEKAAKKARKEKKKKTGKKEDLFDPENLAKYKKELEEKRRRQQQEQEEEDKESDEDAGGRQDKEGELNLNLAVATQAVDSDSDASAAVTPHREAASPAQATPAKDDSENWKLFQSLTSGVDSLIKKTQEELGEIKKESYFQQKQTKLVDKTAEAQKKRELKKKKKWVDLDEEGFEDFDGDVEELADKKKQDSGDEDEDEEDKEEEEEGKEADNEKDQVVQDPQTKEEFGEPEEEEKSKPIVFKEPSVEDNFDPDADDELFSTNFVDAITSGDVKLAVIPDDPVIDEGDDDPFNTAIADVVVKKQQEIKRKEETKLKFTALSSVADVLAGKADKVDQGAIEATVKRKRRRANRINLIGEDATEVTNLEEISSAVVELNKETDQVDILTTEAGAGGKLDIPEGELLVSTPSPCLVSPAEGQIDKKGTGLDVSEFDPEFVDSKEKADLTSNVAILSGEFAKPAEEEVDEFDAAFDALAQESVTKAKLEALEKEFEDDDIFDTTSADKVLQLASLLDKVEEPPAEEEVVEVNFDDPFDTSAYDHITGEVEEELAFESLAKREVEEGGEGQEEKEGVVVEAVKDAGDSAFSTPAVRVNDEDDWAAFAEDGTAIKKKPSRPPPPRPAPKRPPPHAQPYTLSEEDAPPVVVKAPSTESIKSWNCAVADNLIKKSKLESENEALQEEEEEFDPFDTTQFADSGVTNFEDPFDTSAVQGIVAADEPEEEQDDQPRGGYLNDGEDDEEEVPDPFEVLNSIDPESNKLKEVPVIAPQTEKEDLGDEVDPFDTTIAADILPNKGDPFDTDYVKGELGKAELKALEDELLAKEGKGEVGPSGRSRPKGSLSKELSIKLPEDEEEDEVDPFDTTLAEKVISGEPLKDEKREEAAPPPVKVVPVRPQDDDFDPSRSFARSISNKSEKERLAREEEEARIAQKAIEEEEKKKHILPPGQLARPPSKRDVSPQPKKEDSIDSDDFDPRA